MYVTYKFNRVSVVLSMGAFIQYQWYGLSVPDFFIGYTILNFREAELRFTNYNI
jgi:hypothetical protein